MTYKVIIFPTKEILDEMLFEVAVLPYEFCWLWDNPDATYSYVDPETEEVTIKPMPNKIKCNQSLDGRCAIAHNFEDADLEWLQTYWEDAVGYLNGVLFLDNLPEDWAYSDKI